MTGFLSNELSLKLLLTSLTQLFFPLIPVGFFTHFPLNAMHLQKVSAFAPSVKGTYFSL